MRIMSYLVNINFSDLKDLRLKNLAKNSDTDKINQTEIFEFSKSKIGKDSNMYSRLGVSFSSANSSKLSKQNPEFAIASEYYNTQLGMYERSDVTQQTYTNLEERLYKMEKAIDNAFIDCQAYQDIVIVPRWHYRYYPYLNDKLIQFDIDEIRTTTAKDMQSLQELKERVEQVIAEANGEETYEKPEETHYDIEELAQKNLGMSYAEFAELYKNELEFCKTVTSADLTVMNDTQRMVYSKAKAYAAEMVQSTINEAHTTNWDAGNRKLDETMNATDDMLLISDFELDGITDDGISQIKSGILYKSFEDAVIAKYKASCIDSISENALKAPLNKNIKKINNKSKRVEIHTEGSIYDTNGKRIQ